MTGDWRGLKKVRILKCDFFNVLILILSWKSLILKCKKNAILVIDGILKMALLDFHTLLVIVVSAYQ